VAAVRVFQGSLLVCYLAAMTFVRYRLVRTGAAPA
jgi:general nucleoside transport system permease protein